MRKVIKKVRIEEITCDVCGLIGAEEDEENPIITIRILRGNPAGTLAKRGRPKRTAAPAQFPMFDVHERCAKGAYIVFPLQAVKNEQVTIE